MVTILVLFGQLIVLASQTNSVKLQTKILEQQKQILEESSLLNYPKIVITSLGYNCYNITKIYGKSEGRFDIAVTNIGKSAAPWVGVEFGKNQEKLIGTLEKDYFIELTSLNYIGGLVRFNLYDINISEFKFGKRNVIFKINCPLCKKVVDYQNITICIYKNTKEECGEYWTDCKENIIEN